MKKFLILALAFLCGTATASYAQLITSTTSVAERKIEKKRRPTDFSVWYQGELNFGFATGGKLNFDGEKDNTNYSRPFLETIHGVRIAKYGFVGAGVGIQYAFGKMNPDSEYDDKWKTLMIPMFVNLKGYYPVTDDFAPYISISLGGSICATSGYDNSWNEHYSTVEQKLKGGFYGEYGVGFNYKKLNFGLGLQHQSMKFTDSYDGDTDEEKASVNSFFVKVGLKF